MKKFFALAFLLTSLMYSVQAQNDFLRTPKGVQYKFLAHGSGDKIKTDDVITFDVIQKTEKDSVLFSSYAQGHPVKIQVRPSENIGDLMDVFPLLTVNDSVLVRVPTDSVFVGHEDARPPFLPKGSSMVFLLKIARVQALADAIAERNGELDKLRAAETEAANKYIADHKLVLKTTPTGLMYKIVKPSVKHKIVNGDTVLVNYAGRTTDDKVFDSSIEAVAQQAGLQQPGRAYEPLKVVVGQGQVIPGWDEGLLLLNEGSKATFVIPSKLAYADQGAGNDIAPFSTLVFDVEVVKVIPSKHKPVAAGTAKKPAAKKPAAKAPAKAPVKKAVAPAKKN
jgi:FKBP-type peptidyl-prolyl cis-trans isomerase